MDIDVLHADVQAIKRRLGAIECGSSDGGDAAAAVAVAEALRDVSTSVKSISDGVADLATRVAAIEADVAALKGAPPPVT